MIRHRQCHFLQSSLQALIALSAHFRLFSFRPNGPNSSGQLSVSALVFLALCTARLPARICSLARVLLSGKLAVDCELNSNRKQEATGGLQNGHLGAAK